LKILKSYFRALISIKIFQFKVDSLCYAYMLQFQINLAKQLKINSANFLSPLLGRSTTDAQGTIFFLCLESNPVADPIKLFFLRLPIFAVYFECFGDRRKKSLIVK